MASGDYVGHADCTAAMTNMTNAVNSIAVDNTICWSATIRPSSVTGRLR